MLKYKAYLQVCVQVSAKKIKIITVLTLMPSPSADSKFVSSALNLGSFWNRLHRERKKKFVSYKIDS